MEELTFEVVRPWQDYQIRYAMFDFDGTISLIRQGWQDIMIPYFMEVLRETGTQETDQEIHDCVQEFVDRLTGKQTIYQCMALDDAVVARGGPKRDPGAYKKEYLRRLDQRICDRKKALEQGADPEDYIVPGALKFVRMLQQRGIACYLASGTDEDAVKYEAGLLGLDDIFGSNIRGALDAETTCAKELVIRQLMEEKNIQPKELVSFGDGYVEIELVANLGGLAIGAATNEETRQGVNAWKRQRLISAGANAIIPDFRNAEEIIDRICPNP
jgi:phosphoglycolate phosphatase-like HAD superfamily hydrolase